MQSLNHFKYGLEKYIFYVVHVICFDFVLFFLHGQDAIEQTASGGGQGPYRLDTSKKG